MTDEETVRNLPVKSPNSPKSLDSEGAPSEVSEDDSEISSDEDENDDFLKKPFISQSTSPDASSKKFGDWRSHRPESRSRSPSTRRETWTRTVETAESKAVFRKTRTESPKDSISRQNESTTSDRSKSKIHFSPKCVACFLIAVCFGAFVVFRIIPSANSSTQLSRRDRFEKFLKDLRSIENKFPQQNQRSWLQIQAGMKDVINSSSKPWTFVLFSDESETISCLAELLGTASSRALQSENSLVLKPEDMGDEYGETIDRLRPDIKEKKAVVVHNLLEIDPGAIQAFHTMCDRENPLVRGVVYILTIIAPGYTSSQKPEAFVENTLTKKFIDKVHEDKLQPLITRITDGPIIPVVPGNIPNGCFS